MMKDEGQRTKDKKRATNQGAAGFTLMEMVVVVGIFVLTFLVVTSVLINAIKHQRQITATEEALSEAKLAMELIARQARLNRIDYSRYSTAGQLGTGLVEPGGTSVLWLTGQNGQIAFRLENDTNGQPTITVCEDPDETLPNCGDPGGPTFSSILTSKVIVNNLHFDISPRQDPAIVYCSIDTDCDRPGAANSGNCSASPYTPGVCLPDPDGNTYPDLLQPTVTIELNAQVQTKLGASEVTTPIRLQTTVSSRVYQSAT